MGLDFVGVGSLGIDIIKTENAVFKTPGGSAVNTAAALQKLGLKTGVIGRVGKDEYGRSILEGLKNLGVDTRRVIIDENLPTTRCYIDVQNGESKVVNLEYLSRLYTFRDEDKKYLKSAKSIIIGPRLPIFEQYALFAKENNITTYVTLHMSVLDKKIISILNEIKPKAIFANEKEASSLDEMITPETTIVVTKGNEGCSVITSNGSESFPSFKVKPIDPTGAGDSFSAGYIYGDVKKWALKKKLTFANALGALATQQVGARSRLYSLEEIENFIKNKN